MICHLTRSLSEYVILEGFVCFFVCFSVNDMGIKDKIYDKAVTGGRSLLPEAFKGSVTALAQVRR